MAGKGAPQGNVYAKKPDTGKTISLYLKAEEMAVLRLALQQHGEEPSDENCIGFAKEAAYRGIREAIMGTVVEVRFVNPASNETMYDCMTLVSSPEEAIHLAMGRFSGSTGTVKSIEQEGEPVFKPAGVNACYVARYKCVVADDEFDREMIAFLFTQSRLLHGKETGHEHEP